MEKQDIKPHTVYRNKRAGTLGVLYLGYDYGCLSDNEVGIVYQRDDENPRPPIFSGTDPNELEEHALTPEDILSESYIEKACKRGQGEECCRYLIMGSGGFSCAGVSGDTGIALAIDDRVRKGAMTAKKINCGGRYNPTNL